jgi:hypothetical protein
MLDCKLTLILSIIGLCVFLSSCAGIVNDQNRIAKMERFESTIPICTYKADCTAKWEAAQLWIVHNSGFKLQNVTNVLLETYNPSHNSVRLAARVTKEPIGNGEYKIIIKMWCDNIFGCRPDPLDAMLEFNARISSVTP